MSETKDVEGRLAEYERLRDELIDSAVDQENAVRDGDDAAYLQTTNAALDAMEALDEHVAALRSEAVGLRGELERIQRLPTKDWAEVTAAIMTEAARAARAGYKNAKAMAEALDAGKTYVSRLEARAERAEAERDSAIRRAKRIAAHTDKHHRGHRNETEKRLRAEARCAELDAALRTALRAAEDPSGFWQDDDASERLSAARRALEGRE